MKKIFMLVSILIIFLFSTSCDGPTGLDGLNGVDGSNGSTWYNGQGIPSSTTGVDGDYYLDTESSVVYKKEVGQWTIITTISGANGQDGTVWHIGDGAPPIGLGSIGDFYLDYSTSDVYKKESNNWIIYLNIQGTSDNQIRFEFGGDLGSLSEDWKFSEHATMYLTKFNKDYYPNIDSIIFSCSMYTSSADTKCIVELFNVTDNVSIQNTLLESNVTKYIFVDSENILENLPNKEITLAVRIKSEHDGVGVFTGKRSFLFLYRK